MAFIHPVLGGIAVLLGVFIMSRGLVARQGTKASTKARRSHKRWAWWAFGAMVVALGSGVASTLWIRDDLEVGEETVHLELGIAVVVVMGLGGLATRYFTRDPRWRALHPWVGIAAVLGALAQAVIGIELLP